MCLLILITGADPDFPILVASNRDEARDRPASPPGLYEGQQRRMLSPRDRRAGGTWLAVNDRGMLACLTNVAGAPAVAGATTRGALPHLALDHDDLDAAAGAVRAAVQAATFAAFQLALSDGRRTLVLRHEASRLELDATGDSVVVLSNEHRRGQLALPQVAPALAPALTATERLAALQPLLLDEGGPGRHRILKKGGAFGTVSSSLIAVPRADPRQLVWLYAAGPPDEARYRDYGNLGRRLLEG